MSDDITTLTVLKMLGKGRGLQFVGQALKLTEDAVRAIATEYGVISASGILGPRESEAAAARLQTELALRDNPPVREPAPLTRPVAARRNPSPAGSKPLPGYVLIRTALIDTDGRNVRRDGPGDVAELAASIAQVGILQPLTVTAAAGGRYVVELGHRRLAAAKTLHLAEVPCIIRTRRASDPATLRIERLIENLHRAQLAPLEEAEAFEALITEGLNQSEVARRVGISAATVSTRLALLALPRDAKAMIRDRRLPLTEATRLAQQVRKSGHGTVGHTAPATVDYWAHHPLLEEARHHCDHHARRHYGGNVRTGACGPCIEAVIRGDEGLRLLTSPTRKDTPA